MTPSGVTIRPLLPASWRLKQGKLIMFYPGEVGRWKATGHPPPPQSEIQHNSVHLGYPPVQIRDELALLDNTSKILGVMLDTHFTFNPQVRDCVEQASKALKVVKALAGSSRTFTIKN